MLNNITDIRQLNEMETAELEYFIYLDTHGVISLDINSISEITAILSQRYKEAGTFPAKSVSESLQDFHRRYDILRPDETNEQTPSTTPVLSRFRKFRAAIAAVLILVLLVCSVPSVFGASSVLSIFAEWTDSVFTFIKGPQYETPTEKDLNDVKSVVEILCGVTDVVPSWLPEGFEIVSIESFSDKECTSIFADFSFEDKAISLQFSSIYDGASINYEKDTSDVDIYTVEGQNHYIMRNEGLVFCVWATSEVECHIYGDMTSEELYQIINSIYQNLEDYK